jgi:pyridoxamine 5'-phosphate oxidase
MKKGHGGTLDEVLNEVWTMVKRGVTHSNDPFHWPVLGTRGKDACNLRTVILRQFILPDRTLVCYSDARARKTQDIGHYSKVTWLFYHPEKKVQLRISGQARLHTDDEFADHQWAATKITSRLDYSTTHPPGTPVDKPSSGLPDYLLEKIPTLLDSERSRKNFMAISCRINSIDWLMLGALGHRRARFDWDENGLSARWLIP